MTSHLLFHMSDTYIPPPPPNDSIYLLQTEQHMELGMGIYKIGHSTQQGMKRMYGESYRRAKIILYMGCIRSCDAERLLLPIFRREFLSAKGREWFRGDPIRMREHIINQLTTQPELDVFQGAIEGSIQLKLVIKARYPTEMIEMIARFNTIYGETASRTTERPVLFMGCTNGEGIMRQLYRSFGARYVSREADDDSVRPWFSGNLRRMRGLVIDHILNNGDVLTRIQPTPAEEPVAVPSAEPIAPPEEPAAPSEELLSSDSEDDNVTDMTPERAWPDTALPAYLRDYEFVGDTTDPVLLLLHHLSSR